MMTSKVETIPALGVEMEASKIQEIKVLVSVVHPECKAEAEAVLKPEETALVMMAQVVMLKMVI